MSDRLTADQTRHKSPSEDLDMIADFGPMLDGSTLSAISGVVGGVTLGVTSSPAGLTFAGVQINTGGADLTNGHTTAQDEGVMFSVTGGNSGRYLAVIKARTADGQTRELRCPIVVDPVP